MQTLTAMTLVKMLYICLVERILTSEDIMIDIYNASEVTMHELLQRAIYDCKCQLRDLNMNKLVANMT